MAIHLFGYHLIQFITGDRCLYFLDRDKGFNHIRWWESLSDASAPEVFRDALYAAAQNGFLYFLEIKDADETFSKEKEVLYLHPKANQMIEAFDSANQLVKDEVLALPEE